MTSTAIQQERNLMRYKANTSKDQQTLIQPQILQIQIRL